MIIKVSDGYLIFHEVFLNPLFYLIDRRLPYFFFENIVNFYSSVPTSGNDNFLAPALFFTHFL
ncbi:MAG: hypothetical protein D3923_12565 [Candidatus Electrothrix sp. AR3]|nr:hypothetical protein [Candidatus Electrothrix sp. AR3]